MPKSLMNDIREGSIDIADQTVELEDLDSAYEKDYDKESVDGGDQQDAGGMGDSGMGDLGMGDMGMGGGMGGGTPPSPGPGMGI